VPSRLRTILILAAVAIAGFVALAAMAERYRRMTPQRSVLELSSETEPSAATAAPGVVEAPAPPEEPAPSPLARPEESAAPADADVAAVERFLEVRGAIREYLEGNRRAARTVAAIVEEGQTTSKTRPADPRFLAGYRGVRADALARAGTSAEEYARVRASFTAWRKGEGKDGLGAAFAARGEAAALADLGALETVDYEVSF
jgi:hypothetical protein